MTDSFSGFIFNFCTAGGASSGLTAKVMSNCAEKYPSKMLENYSLIPDYNGTVTASQIYNTALLLNYQL
jgi:hypothetical protein